MMKAAQTPGVGGGLPLGGPNSGSHSPQHQSLHPGMLFLAAVSSNHIFFY
jgi:hypothetical protein